MPAHVGTFPATIATTVTTLTTAGIGVSIPAGACGVGIVRASGTIGCSDSVNGAWTSVDNDGNSHAAFVFQNMAAAAGTGTTLTGTGTSGTIRLIGGVFSDVATSGQPLGHTNIGTNAAAQTTYTATAIAGDPGGDVVWGGFFNGGADYTGFTLTAGSADGVGMAIGGQLANVNGIVGDEYLLSSAVGTDAATITLSSGDLVTGAQFFQIVLSSAAAASSPHRAFLPLMAPQGMLAG